MEYHRSCTCYQNPLAFCSILHSCKGPIHRLETCCHGLSSTQPMAPFSLVSPVVLAFRRPLRARRSGASENGECRPRIPSGRISPYDTAVTRDLIWVGTVRLQHRERFQECLRVPRSHLGCLGVPVCPCPRFRFITSAQAKHSLR